MNPFREMLQLQWRASRWVLLPFVLVCMGAPLFIMRMIELAPGYSTFRTSDVLRYESAFVALFPVLALMVGSVVALTSWSWDHQARHIYALSLPLTRAKYATYKFAAGLTILMLPIAAVFVGSLMALSLTSLPSELHAYPFAFTARFALASAVAFAVIFSMAASTVRTAVIIIISLFIIAIPGSIAVEFINHMTRVGYIPTPAEVLFRVLVTWPGPFAVFGGSWALIDV